MTDEGGGASRSTDPAAGTSSATDVSLREHLETIVRMNDRRYTELAVEREKALQIKEKADTQALLLAREIQTYKDEKANELREQINRERGNYATKDDLVAAVEKLEETIKPLANYVGAQAGPRALTGTAILAALGGLVLFLSVLGTLAAYIASR